MKSLIALLLLAGMVGRLVCTVRCCQVGSASDAVAEELVEVMLREGGQEAAAELAEMGGAAAVRELLDKAASEGGDQLVVRVAQYATRYGPPALRAIEPSPARMAEALDAMPPELIAPAIRAAAREPQLTARLVAAYGNDALAVAAKHPGVGATLAEKLGADGIVVGQTLTTDQAVTLARYADDIATLAPDQRKRLLAAIASAPAAVLDYLETHPKVLLTAGGVAAVIAARDRLFGGTASSGSPLSPPPGLVERLVFGVMHRLAVPIKMVMAIILGGLVCHTAISVRSAWKLRAMRLAREEARIAEELAHPVERND